MGKTKTVILMFAFMSVLYGCETDNKISSSNSLSYIKTIPGGCNIEDISVYKTKSFTNDTIYVSTVSDTLIISVGINYICSAPFATETTVNEDSINIVIKDTCNTEDNNCYARCNCYYTWNFFFNEFLENEYYFKIILVDPRQEEPSVLKEGLIEISQTI